MKTLYSACLSRLGLSQVEAAALHDVGLPTVKHWAAGRRPVPDGIWDDLRGYEARIIDASEAAREAWEDGGETRRIDATVADDLGLMALADFLLGSDEEPPIYANNARLAD
ncbi:MAG: hypothetical protein WDA25_00920 [Paracoccaceae bacterium]